MRLFSPQNRKGSYSKFVFSIQRLVWLTPESLFLHSICLFKFKKTHIFKLIPYGIRKKERFWNPKTETADPKSETRNPNFQILSSGISKKQMFETRDAKHDTQNTNSFGATGNMGI